MTKKEIFLQTLQQGKSVMSKRAKALMKIAVIAVVPGAIPVYLLYVVSRKLLKKTVDSIGSVCDATEEEN